MALNTLILFGTAFSCMIYCGNGSRISFEPSEVKFGISSNYSIEIRLSEPINETVEIVFTYQTGDTTKDVSYKDDSNIIKPLAKVEIPPNTTKISVVLQGANAGHVIIGMNSTDKQLTNVHDIILRVSVVHSVVLVTLNAVIGWIYFAAWSISFYPQVYMNWTRKSVIGLNFDFLAYNITGFLAYGFFNVGMYWVDTVKMQYFQQHPRGVNPVQLNDVVFTIHAVFITCITIFQCFIYERGGQKMSKVALVLVPGSWLFAFVALFVTIFKKITWLTYLYYFSYIKLGVTLIKYMPQAWMNFRRKSTEGWSIGNVLLDFTGGSLSLVQMFLISYNNDDWGSIFGDPTKFGLGFFSILFDILFIIQHYCLYRNAIPYSPINQTMKTPDGQTKEHLYT